MDTQNFIPKSLKNSIENASHTWLTPSNIALVKYWGKSEPQIPKNASVSFTLSKSHTKTTIDFTRTEKVEIPEFDLFFEGKKKDDFKPKIAKFFERILEYCPYLLEYRLTIHSENSFPHSSGIASSASGMSAIAMCLMSLERSLCDVEISDEFITKKASFLARLGSGSASRSIEGPLVVWGKHEAIEESSDLYGVQFPYKVHSIFENYQDTILLVDKGEKQVSSTVGHNLMHNHPFAKQRFDQANENLERISKYLQNGDINSFISLVESEALSLHAMMLTSNPYFILMKPNTLEIINAIWRYRNVTGSNVCFTLDAGANVHVLYPENEKENVLQFIEEQLSQYCQKNQYICDNVGFGAKKL
ncbi:diphosphomevalonate decarboxylase [Pseudotenacibaculum sp. MALMAid0570]|uniref:diphosphomevalonate/mevalonate 3,5-bisphosphate decarboxylase family protein n=1 Tax=Pseudotenacibaculum sp. MALMAid0570 TaxID=3143938 RepID=UPI0032E00FC9